MRILLHLLCAWGAQSLAPYLEAHAVFTDAIQGSIVFGQVPGQDGTAKFNFASGAAAVDQYHIHNFPILSSQSCQEKGPILLNLGDTFGTLSSVVNTNKTDAALMLHGPNSIVGRSIVLHKSDYEPLECANIIWKGVNVVQSYSEFRTGDLTGYLQMTSARPSAASTSDPSLYPTAVYLKVDYKSGTLPTDLHDWDLVLPPDGTQTCANLISQTGYTLVGLGKAESGCATSNPDGCQIGNMGGKHGQLAVPGQHFYTDSNLPLFGSDPLALAPDNFILIFPSSQVGADPIGCAQIAAALTISTAPPTNPVSPTPSGAPAGVSPTPNPDAGIIAGAVIGGVVGLALIGGLVFFLIKRGGGSSSSGSAMTQIKQQNSSNNAQQQSSSNTGGGGGPPPPGPPGPPGGGGPPRPPPSNNGPPPSSGGPPPPPGGGGGPPPPVQMSGTLDADEQSPHRGAVRGSDGIWRAVD